MAEDFNLFWSVISICYFVGGLTIGWWVTEWKHRRKPKRSGMGRWDWTNRRYPNGDDDGAYFK